MNRIVPRLAPRDDVLRQTTEP
ncbi:MAG: hypothetical protein RLZZ341_1299, partial [Pseudomonadota bacterium]